MKFSFAVKGTIATCPENTDAISWLHEDMGTDLARGQG